MSVKIVFNVCNTEQKGILGQTSWRMEKEYVGKLLLFGVKNPLLWS
jgi:hypothetical protein